LIQLILLSCTCATASVPESSAVPSVALVAAMNRNKNPLCASWLMKITGRPSAVCAAATAERAKRPSAVRLVGKLKGSSGLTSVIQLNRGATVGSL